MIAKIEKERDKKQILIRLDHQLATQFKVLCARRSISMNKMINRLVRKLVRKHNDLD